MRMVSLREIKLDSASLKLSIIPLDHIQNQKRQGQQRANNLIKLYSLSKMNAAVELPSDGEEDYDDTSESNLEQSQQIVKRKKLKKVLVNIDTKQEEKSFTHEVVIQFLIDKKLPLREEKLIFFTESKEWSTFWRNTIQGLHDSNRKFTYNNNITRDVLPAVQSRTSEKEAPTAPI